MGTIIFASIKHLITYIAYVQMQKYISLIDLANLAAAVDKRIHAEGFTHCWIFQRLKHAWDGLNEGRLIEMLEKDELVVLILSVHAVVGLHVFRFEDWAVGVVEIFLSEDLHRDIMIIIYFIIQL